MDGEYNGFGNYGQSETPRYGGFGKVYGANGASPHGNAGDGREAGGGQFRGAYDEARLREDLTRYGNMSGESLTEELVTRAKELRSEGKLDTALLEDFASKAAPFLSAAELARLRELISMLKNV